MEQAMARGVPAQQIAFVSFTRAAVKEARDRAIAQFSLSPDAMPYFRTLHSLCFHELGLRRNDVFNKTHLKPLGELLGEELSGVVDLDAPAGSHGDGLMHLDHYARVTLRSLQDAWHEHGGEIEWWRLLRFSQTYEQFRRDYHVLDFTEMLSTYVEQGDPVPVQLAFIDEAQDLTPLQWRVVWHAFGVVPELYVGADDDQCIYRWSGATASALVDWQGTHEVLPHSYRLPHAIWSVAGDLAARIEHRAPKVWTARHGAPGSLEYIRAPDEIDLSAGTWLLLARTRRQLRALQEVARWQGVTYRLRGASSVNPEWVRGIQLYERLRAGRGTVDPDEAATLLRALGRRPDERGLREDEVWDATTLGIDTTPIWHDALLGIPLDEREYYLACLRRNENLLAPPRVRIETIHGAKGLEADHVCLLTSTTGRIQRGFELDPDSEHRVFYVGVTRARESLWIVQPTGPHGYQI
jgi:superfamily I DNA/RNA helicase